MITVLCKYSDSVERASVDEAYVDVTDQVQTRLAQMEDQGQVLDPEQLRQTFIAGHDDAQEGVDIEGDFFFKLLVCTFSSSKSGMQNYCYYYSYYLYTYCALPRSTQSF